MLDPSIITNGTLAAQAQQEANMKAMGDLGGAFGKLLLARQINDMNQMATPEEEKAFAQKHKLFVPQLMQQYADNRAAEAKALKDGLKFDADLNKTYADTAQTYALGRKNDADAGKSTAEGKKVGVETTGLDIDQNAKLDSMVWGSVLNGGKNAGIAQLEIQKSRGLIDEATYNQKLGLINNLPADPAQAQKYAFAMYKGIQDPKYNLTTADNVLDNETSTNNNVRDNTTSANNNIRSTQASMYASDNSLKGTMYSSDNSLKGTMYSSDNSLEGTKYTANQATYRTEKEIEAAKKQGKQQLINGLVYTVYPDGTADAFIDPRTGQQATSLGDGSGNKNSPQQETKRAQNVLTLTQQAEQILSSGKATGSGIGSLLDTGASWFGVSTEGAQGTAQLSTIAGQLVSNMPRMEGPQSDKDVQMYKQMAGDLSNASLPVATRMAALRQLQALNEKYLNNGSGGYPAASAPPESIAAPKTPSGKPRPPLSAYGF
ncbi:hypothetical protein ENHAE0001_2219 [Enhydrobacter aerosaccus SK60]|nr:hypothetical protein ENHAE0001_2219 [Enhydrobacter aerosaccus SK60]